ncbi:MAG: serine acetyltransferase, partial [Peristeroidobacter soli]
MAKTWMTEYGSLTDGWESPFAADVRRHYEICDGTHWDRVIQCVRAPGVQAMAVLRFGQWTLQQPRWARWLVDPLYVVANLYIKVFWGLDLSRYTQIGPGLYIAHFGGITISPFAILGRNCNISQSVTIGVAGHGAREGAPVIGNDVYIAPGARVFGKINIGNNVKIGANAVVYKDIPDNAVVALDPGFK